MFACNYLEDESQQYNNTSYQMNATNIPLNNFIYDNNNDHPNEPARDSYYHELYGCRMSFSDFIINAEKFTICQKQAMDYIHKTFTKGTLPVHIFFTGPGGVGKSFFLNMVAAYLDHHTAKISGTSPVKICAPTGTAAHNIRGQTIHSLLKIPVEKYLLYSALSAFELKRLKTAFAGVHSIIVDEVSMVSDRFFTFVSRRPSEISGSSEPFGGFNVFLFGELFQLRPVFGKYLFHNEMLCLVVFFQTNFSTY